MYERVTSETPIKPEHIDASQHLMGAFDKDETEVSAGWLVRFAQHRNRGWEPFTEADINEFYRRMYPEGTYHFQGLDARGWIHKDGGTFYFTKNFVARCYKARPKV